MPEVVLSAGPTGYEGAVGGGLVLVHLHGPVRVGSPAPATGLECTRACDVAEKTDLHG